MKLRGFLAFVYLACFCVILAGCSGGGGSGHRVKGQVLLDGKAVSDAHVVFEGDGGNTAVTNAEGKFEFTGATPFTTLKPGKYRVMISKYVDIKTGNTPDKEDLEQLKAAGTIKNLVPAKYSDLEMDVLTADIKEGANDL